MAGPTGRQRRPGDILAAEPGDVAAPAGSAGRREPTAGFFEAAWRHAVAIAIVVAVAAAGAYVLSSRRPATYEATTVLLFADPAGWPADQSSPLGQNPGRYLATQADLVTSEQVTAATAQELADGASAADVAESLTAVPGEFSDTLAITASAGSADRAARMANAAAAAYLTVVRQQGRADATAAVRALQQQYDEVRRLVDQIERRPPQGFSPTDPASALRDRLSEISVEQSRLRTVANTYEPAVRVAHSADPPAGPVSPVPLRDAGLAALIALLVGGAAAWAFEVSVRRRADPDRLTRLLGAQCLGFVPGSRVEAGDGAAGADDDPGRDPALTPPARTPVLDPQWQDVVSAMDASLRGIDGRCVLVTSPVATGQEGRTAALLAVSAAADGRSVIVVDADQAHRELSGLAGADTCPGLTELVEQDGRVRPVGDVRPGKSTVDVIAVGRSVPNPAAFYRSERFRVTLDSLRRHANLVIVAGPPVPDGPDACVLADSADAVLLVVPEDVADDDLRAAKARLSWSQGRLLGYLILKADRRRVSLWRRSPGGRDGRGAATEASSLGAFLKPVTVVFRGVVAHPNGRLPVPSPERGT